MSWAKLDDGFHDHPKILMTSNAAVGVHVKALTYCARHLTDGFVPTVAVAVLGGTVTETDELVRNNLWCAEAGGFRIHDFLDYQPSSKLVKRERKRAKVGMRKVRARYANVTRNAPDAPAVTPGRDGTGRDGVKRSEDALKGSPQRTATDTKQGRSSAELTAAFETRFWPAYPPRKGRRDGKAPALALWLNLKPDVALEGSMLEALRAYAASTELPCDAARWLKHRRWEDDIGVRAPNGPRRMAAGGVPMMTAEETLARQAERKRNPLPINPNPHNPLPPLTPHVGLKGVL